MIYPVLELLLAHPAIQGHDGVQQILVQAPAVKMLCKSLQVVGTT